MLSASELSDEDAEEISELYFLLERDIKKIGQAMGFDRPIPADYLTCEKVRKLIESKAREMRSIMTREEHIRNLQDIKDMAMKEETLDLKIALAAEIASGNAAGLYEKLPATTDTSPTTKDVKELSSEEITKMLSKHNHVEIEEAEIYPVKDQ